MIKAMNRAAIATAVRAALASGKRDAAGLTTELVTHLNSMAVPIQLGETVPVDRYNLLLLKFQALEQLVQYYDAHENGTNKTQA